MKYLKIKIVFIFLLYSYALISFSQSSNAGFGIIRNGRPAALKYNGHDQVIKTAIDIYSTDIENVTGKPFENEDTNGEVIYIGTLADKGEFSSLLKQYQVNVTDIEGQWEAFKIEAVMKDDTSVLFIIGSDTRGAAYGVMELLKIAGVSSWIWWADVPYPSLSELILPAGYSKTQMPSVKYRGIFINDEDWCLVPWSAGYEGQEISGRVGPKTYSKVFELLLRLKANTIWPAMHPSTEAFYKVEGNKEAAQKYGIFVGTSHCEPMMRNNVGEWDQKLYGSYDFTTNHQNVLDYWKERTLEVSGTDVITTLGMRGIHDDKMEGVTTLDEQTELTNIVIENQRRILSEVAAKDISLIPQTFVPYKEVLKIYENGLKIPEDVTLTWCDDNYGYITRLSTSEENKRSGGSGVYYHVSYWGKPHDYLWLASTQPSLIYSEMKKAWDYGARKLWILNVGDIKPAEYLMQFYLDLAWDIDIVTPENIYSHQKDWLSFQFGEDSANAVFDIMKEYYRLASIRKPEHMGWSRVQQPGFNKGFSPVTDTEFNSFDNSVRDRLEAYTRIAEKSENILKDLPNELHDAYWQLIHYPVCAATEMNRKLLYAQNARKLAPYVGEAAREYATMSTKAYNKINELTRYYNEGVAGGKWKGMMDAAPRGLNVFKQSELSDKYIEKNEVVVFLEGNNTPLASGKEYSCPAISSSGYFTITLHGVGKDVAWSVTSKPDWVKVSRRKGLISNEMIINLSVKDSSAGSGEGLVELNVDKAKYFLKVFCQKPHIDLPDNCHIENKGIIAFNAYKHNKNGKAARYITEGLGHSLGAVSMKKADKRRIPAGNFLEYDVYTYSTGDLKLTAAFIPVHAVNGGEIGYAVSIDGGEPQLVRLDVEAFETEEWKVNVLRNQSIGVTNHKIDLPGLHKIRIYALSDDMQIDQLMLNFGTENRYEIPVAKLSE